MLALGASSTIDLEALEGVDREDIETAPECAVLRLAQKRRLLNALNRPRPKPSPPPAPPPPPYAPGFLAMGKSLAAPLADTHFAGWLRRFAGYAADVRLGSVSPGASRARPAADAATAAAVAGPTVLDSTGAPDRTTASRPPDASSALPVKDETTEGEEGPLGSAEVAEPAIADLRGSRDPLDGASVSPSPTARATEEDSNAGGHRSPHHPRGVDGRADGVEAPERLRTPRHVSSDAQEFLWRLIGWAGRASDASGDDDEGELDEDDLLEHDELRARALRRLQADWDRRL